jgi:hypothetical protein
MILMGIAACGMVFAMTFVEMAATGQKVQTAPQE